VDVAREPRRDTRRSRCGSLTRRRFWVSAIATQAVMRENAALISAARGVGVEFFHIDIGQFAYSGLRTNCTQVASDVN
jgi:hypothetical protein